VVAHIVEPPGSFHAVLGGAGRFPGDDVAGRPGGGNLGFPCLGEGQGFHARGTSEDWSGSTFIGRVDPRACGDVSGVWSTRIV